MWKVWCVKVEGLGMRGVRCFGGASETEGFPGVLRMRIRFLWLCIVISFTGLLS